MFTQVVWAVHHIHQFKQIHRDLKPGNVLIDHVDGDRLVVRVADFGIAKWQTPDAEMRDSSKLGLLPDLDVQAQLVQTAPGIRLGTPEYIPPEQAFAKGIDETVDLYALGVMFYEMLLGRKPFSAENAQGMYLAHLYEVPKSLLSVAPDIEIPQKVDDLILSLMQKLPGDRPQKAKSVLKMVNRMIHEAPLIEQTLTEIPALKPFLNRADDDDEVFADSRHSNGRMAFFTVVGVAVGLGLSVLLF